MAENPETGRWRGSADERLDRHKEWLEDHENRLTNNEKAIEMAKGGMLVLSLIVGSGLLVRFLGV